MHKQNGALVDAEVAHPIRLVAEHGHQIAVTVVVSDNDGERDLPSGLVASNFERGSMTGSDAGGKGDGAQPVRDTSRPTWTTPAVLPPLERAESAAQNGVSLAGSDRGAAPPLCATGTKGALGVLRMG